MKQLDRKAAHVQTHYPTRIVQFGTGNFLRAHVDWMVDILNEKAGYNSGIQIVKLVPGGNLQSFNEQEGLYHVLVRGVSNGTSVDETRLITCVQGGINPYTDFNEFLNLAREPELQLVFSNSTEAGIEFISEDTLSKGKPALSFPGKLTQFLKERFDFFKGNSKKGLCYVPCELIENNGHELRNKILQYANSWNYPEDFIHWIENHNYFANTLVDRIVPGFPTEEAVVIKETIGFEDQYIVSAEPFHLLVIDGPVEIRRMFPADTVGLNVKFTNDITPYRTTKVRILNGAHTSMVAVGLLSGLETVRGTIEDDYVGPFIEKTIAEEISSTINLDAREVSSFANEVLDRFKNPYIYHELKAISLNSIAKFKVRVLPTILDFLKNTGTPPKRLLFVFACLLKLYTDPPANVTLNDDQTIIDFFRNLKSQSVNQKISSILSNTQLWGIDLTGNKLLSSHMENYYESLSSREDLLIQLKALL